MRVTIADKDQIQKKVDQIIACILQRRAWQDHEYEIQWRSEYTGMLWWKKKNSGKPPISTNSQGSVYPTSRWGNWLRVFILLDKLLKDENFKDISLDELEYDSFIRWCDVAREEVG